jgi:hypothetical protein
VSAGPYSLENTFRSLACRLNLGPIFFLILGFPSSYDPANRSFSPNWHPIVLRFIVPNHGRRQKWRLQVYSSRAAEKEIINLYNIWLDNFVKKDKDN